MRTIRSSCISAFLVFVCYFLLVNGDDLCLTPYGFPGYCLWAEECSSMKTILINSRANFQYARFVHDSHCKTEKIDGKIKNKVCCDLTDLPGCMLPNQPKNGAYGVNGLKQSSDVKVSIATTLHYSCTKNYTPFPQNESICEKGEVWSANVECIRTCNNVKSSTVTMKCKFNDNDISCDGAMYEGTVVTAKCKPGHRVDTGLTSKDLKCVKGQWDNTVPKCSVVECGLDNTIGNSTDPTILQSPWNAEIYAKERVKYKHACGGAILSNKVIITSAVCLMNIKMGKARNVDDLAVAIGKPFGLRKRMNETAQKSKVSEIIFEKNFAPNISLHNNNVALLILKDELFFSGWMHPVCFDGTDENLYKKHLKIKTIGKTRTNATLEVVDIDLYKSEIDDRPMKFDDKFCVGNSDFGGLIIKDIGYHLSFPLTTNNITKYYIRGIFDSSYFKIVGIENAESFAIFTDLWFHKKFIQENIEKYR